jgi:hypothetical protein
MKNRFGLFGGIGLAVVVSLSVISAQERQPAPERVIQERAMIDKIEHERMMQEHPHPPMPPGGDFVFFASEMSFGGKLVKGAPYSAEAITESMQTLSDGNRIVNKSTASIYRDSEGRTRREQALRAIGPFANDGALSQTIHISDPVAAVSYVLDPRAQVARKMPPMRFKFEFKTPPPDGPSVDPAATAPYRIELHSDGIMDKKMADKKMAETGVAIGLLDKNNPNSRTEPLGKQNIGGVEAEGTKTTVTIPAGEIGNEKPIEIVSERWYSPELQIVLMTRHIDPRFGENSYRLANIDRTEPARSLFEVPAGYRIEEGPGLPSAPGQKIRTRKPVDEQ